ncbi:MAG: twin-arginine translocase subunit TatC [Actinomycetota bacterium]|nr:twin-arginine translocase subunit TatC [Actinomycetota bacterium]
MAKLRPVQHEDHLTVVEHLDELRTRLVVSVAAFVVAGAFCFWQNHLIFDIANAPLEGKKPVTLGVAESFMTTATLSAYAAILISLPVILFQLYAFVLPAFSPTERRVTLPLLLLVPILFVSGVVFGYYVVLPPALEFLLNFNTDEFNQLIRARDYYSFVSLTLVSMGILFQVPIGILALTRLGVVTPRQLRRNRRYAVVAMAVLAALLPSLDPITMLIEMVPLLLLYEGSILLASAFGRPPAEVSERLAPAEGS